MTNYMDPSSIKVTSDFDAFVSIARHLITQREKCMNALGDCAYRGSDDIAKYSPDDVEFYDGMDIIPNEYSCAVGILIKDQFYDSELEGNDVYAQIVQEAVKDSHPDWVWSERSVELLKLMQKVHDQVDIQLWPVFLCEIAEYFVTAIGQDPVYAFNGDMDDISRLAFDTLNIEYDNQTTYLSNLMNAVDMVPPDLFEQYLVKFESMISELERG